MPPAAEFLGSRTGTCAIQGKEPQVPRLLEHPGSSAAGAPALDDLSPAAGSRQVFSVVREVMSWNPWETN